MSYAVRLHVWGDRACFTRPEMKVERVSYDVMTPSAARGILDAIYWKPAILWAIDKIQVLKPIHFESIRRNEVAGRASHKKMCISVEDERQQRASTILKNVEYIISAHFELTGKAGKEEKKAKHLDIFKRRARKGQCFHTPYFGVREFPANFCLLEEGETFASHEEVKNKDLGWMLHDLDFQNDMEAKFFRARIDSRGIVNIPSFHAQGVKS